jgi:hypothetical protein
MKQTRKTLRWVQALVTLAGALNIATAQTSGAPVNGTFSGLVFNRTTQTFNSVLTLVNNGATLYPPLTINISTGTSAVTVNGASSNGNNSFSTKVQLSNGSLLSNESAKFTVAFADPTRVSFAPALVSAAGASAPTGLSIAVLSPKPGQMALAPSFVVAGTVSGSGTFGASVDGIAACIAGSQFFINNFSPQTAPSRFSAAASDVDGGQVTQTVAIVPTAKGLQVRPSPTCGGIAPLTTTFSISLNAQDGDTLSSVTVDFGAGGGPQAFAMLAPIQNTYVIPGLYLATITATTTSGATLTQSAWVSVQTSAQAFAPILKNVSLLQAALGSQNVARALSYHSYTAQARYAPVLTQTGINLPGLATLLTTAQPVMVRGNYAEIAVSANTTKGLQSSSIVLTKDGSGLWRVDSW